ncbi:MAG: Protein containing Heat shock protein Hsp20 protein [Parcubacteria group bacterium GW2011_GWC1_38_6]|nr:MAG: Protein containing Heat shock protein Hsp20 protein [Parcubacteria group bacterium GW2011_GWC1_38_6]
MPSFFEKLKGVTHDAQDTEDLEESGVIEEKLPEEKITREEPAKENAEIELVDARSKKVRKTRSKKEEATKAVTSLSIATPIATQSADKEKEIPLPKAKNIKEKKWPEPEGQLAVDVYQTDDELIIQSAIAGIKPGDLDITAQGDTVVIRGIRENGRNEEKNYFYKECFWGKFSREIILPIEADAARAEASMTDGVLTIRIPKIEKGKTKKIVIQ